MRGSRPGDAHACPHSIGQAQSRDCPDRKAGWEYGLVVNPTGDGKCFGQPAGLAPTIASLAHPPTNRLQLAEAPLKCDTYTLKMKRKKKKGTAVT